MNSNTMNETIRGTIMMVKMVKKGDERVLLLLARQGSIQTEIVYVWSRHAQLKKLPAGL